MSKRLQFGTVTAEKVQMIRSHPSVVLPYPDETKARRAAHIDKSHLVSRVIEVDSRGTVTKEFQWEVDTDL